MSKNKKLTFNTLRSMLIDGYAVHLVQGNFKENHFENAYIVLD